MSAASGLAGSRSFTNSSSFSQAVPTAPQCCTGLHWENTRVTFLLRGGGKLEHEWDVSSFIGCSTTKND